MSDDVRWLEHTIVYADGDTTVDIIGSSWQSAPSVLLSGMDAEVIVNRKTSDPHGIVRQEFRPAAPPKSEASEGG